MQPWDTARVSHPCKQQGVHAMAGGGEHTSGNRKPWPLIWLDVLPVVPKQIELDADSATA